MSNPISPEDVAAMATRLYRQDIVTDHAAMASPSAIGIPTTTPPTTVGMPARMEHPPGFGSNVGTMNTISRTTPPMTGVSPHPSMHTHPPTTAFPSSGDTNPSMRSMPNADPRNQDGIKRFVEFVRHGHHGPSQASPSSGSMPSMPTGFPNANPPAFPTGMPVGMPMSPSMAPPYTPIPGATNPAQLPKSTPAGFPLFHRGFGDRTFGNEGARPFDVQAIRADFPVLHQLIHGKPLVWLDNAATTQKPQSVIDAISRYYAQDNSNIHRAAHTLAARSTDAYEQARDKVRDFLGASSSQEIVFVRGTTEAINLIANTFGNKFLQPGDEILVSVLEHHANIVPWQMIAQQRGAVIRVIPVNDQGEIMMQEYARLLNPKTRLVSLTQASNSLGTILPVEEMTKMAKRYGARVLIDGAQSVAHLPIRVQEMGCDFFVFSGHKIFGPTGIGVAYIREELHEVLPPWQGGGNMIRNVTFEQTEYADAPAKFEAGTPNIADAVGLGAALDYVSRLGLPNIANYEHGLLEYATERILRVPGLRLIGTAREKVGVLSFVLNNRSTEEVGKALDQQGIAVRAGHHCAQPSLRRFGLETTVRPSLSLYNTHAEVDHLVDVLRFLQQG